MIIRPRIVVPRRREELLTRPRLLDRMMEFLDKRLVIISAPAGYGKTTLLVDFIHQQEWPACWYAIDELDRDPLRFIAHFIASIQVRFPQFGGTAKGILSASTQDHLNLDMLVAAVVNDVYEAIPEHFVMVLDDYHLVDDSHPVNQFISRFLQTVGENSHLFIASRTLLTLPDLPLLVVREEVAGLSIDDLSFLPDEIQALYLQNERKVLPTDLANDLARRTEGWIAGLLLTSQQLANETAPTRRGVLKATGVGLDEYLARQVLEKQPEEIREFLLRSSLLEVFDDRLCAEVIGPALNLELDWAGLMEAAQRNNLFILPIDEEERWLRYHHLFLEFLQRRMLEQRPEEARSIQMQLAAVYARRGEWEEAYRVHQRLGQIEAQVTLVEHAGSELMTSGRLDTLFKWLSNLPPAMRLARPVLLSLQGGLAFNRGEPAEAEILLEQAIQGFRKDEDQYQLALALIRRSAGRRLVGKYDDALSDADQALEMLHEKSRAHAEAQRARGTALMALGRTRSAIEQLSHAHHEYLELNDSTSAARLLIEIGMARRSLGQLDEAELAYSQALELWEKDRNFPWQANVLNNLGVLQHERGEFLTAVHSLERSVECARLAIYPRMEAFALTGLGDLYRDLEAFSESAEAYRQAAALAERVNERFLIFYLDLARGVLARRQLRFPTARDLLAAAAVRAEESGSELDRATCRLEQAASLLMQEKFMAVEPQLAEAARFFTAQGRRLEAARCQLILMLAAAGCGEMETAQTHKQALAELWDSPTAWPPLVAAAREFLPLLQRLQGLPDLEPQAGRLLRQADQLNQHLPGLRRQLRPQVGVVPLGPAHMSVQTLGRMEVRINRSLIGGSDWRSVTARDLFFFLLIHPEGLTKEQIGLVFWPDASPGQLQQRFRNLIYRLRHAVGSEVVVLGPDELYRFNHSLDYEYDVEAFERELNLAEQVRDDAARLDHLMQAIRIYKGVYLSEVDTEWALVEREHLKQANLDALVRAAALSLALRRPEQALQSSLRALQSDPGLEEAHRLAMRGYAAEGDRAGIIRQYQTCRQFMLDEFNAEPSPQTTQLYEDLTR